MNRIDLHYDVVDAKLRRHAITENGCWKYGGEQDSSGHGLLDIQGVCSDSRKRTYKAHRVAFAVYQGIDPRAGTVNHICDNLLCINPDHLFIGDHLENTVGMEKIFSNESASNSAVYGQEDKKVGS